MKPTVLIVEDEPSIADIFAKIVLSIDCSYIRASKVSEALYAMHQKKFEVVICDLLLPDGSGIQVAEKAVKKGCSLIIVTGYAERYAKDLSKLSKINPGIKILHKPFPMIDLERSLLELVEPFSR